MTTEEICNRLRELKALIVEAKAEKDRRSQASSEAFDHLLTLQAEYSKTWNELDKVLGEPSFDLHDLQSKYLEFCAPKPS